MPDTASPPAASIWKLEVYDESGQPIATAIKPALSEPARMFGSAEDLAESVREVASLDKFFTDPEQVARRAYEAMLEEQGGGMSWDRLCETPALSRIVAGWRAVGRSLARPA